MRWKTRKSRVTLGDASLPLLELSERLATAEKAAANSRRDEKANPEPPSAETGETTVAPVPVRKAQLTATALERLNSTPPSNIKKVSTQRTGSKKHSKRLNAVPTIKPVKRPVHVLNPKPAVLENLLRSRAVAADKVRALVSASTPSIEGRPDVISAEAKARIDGAISVGAGILRDRPEPDDDGYIIGFDFGTSSLKVAYRQPYVADDPVAVIPVPDELRSGGHPGLWQSVVWFEPEAETFSLYPIDGGIALDGFKTGLIGGNGDKPMPQAPAVTRAQAATAFLALHFAYMVGAYSLERPLDPVGADHFMLINIGIPVAVRDDKRAFADFSRLVAAAYALAPNPPQLNLTAIKSALVDASTGLPEFLQLVPELTAAIAGYAADPMVQLGAHILVDVGASTLDIVAFNLQATLTASVFTAGVDLFGAGALMVARDAGIEDKTFKQACDHLFDDVFRKAKAEQRAPSLFRPGQRRMPVQLVITGGGCDTDLHTRFIEEIPQEGVLGAIPLKRPSPPPKILRDGADQSRLLLAYGLTRDVTELHQLRLPSEIEDISPRSERQVWMVDKDIV